MRPGDPLYFSFGTQDGTGAALNADSTPTATLRRNGSNDGTVTVTVTNNATGDYTASATIPATYSGGDRLELIIAATVKGVAGKFFQSFAPLERALPDLQRLYRYLPGTTWYVATNGSDGDPGTAAAPFGTIAHAISVAAFGDLIRVGAGTFAQGNAVLNLPDGVSLSGAGQRLTVISSTANLTDLGCIVSPGNGSRVEHLTIAGVGTGVYQGPFGWNAAATSPQADKTNWVLNDVYTTGDSDGLLIHSVSATPPAVRGLIYNCVFRSKYDTVNVFNPAVPWDILLDFVNPNFCANGPSIVGAGAFTARALAIGVGVARVFGGVLKASGNTGGSANNVAVNVDGGTHLELYDTVLLSSGDNAKDIAVGSGACLVSGVFYDTAKTSGSVVVRATGTMHDPQSLEWGPVALDGVQQFNNTGQTTPLSTTYPLRRNTPLPDFEFPMRVAGVDTPGLTVAGQVSIDGAAFINLTNTAAITDMGNGIYKIDLTAADLNGTTIMLRFTASGATPTLITMLLRS